MVFIHDTIVARQLGAGDRRADRADPRRARAADVPAAEVDAGDAAAGSADQRAEREVQGRQTAPAAGADEILPREQNQSFGILPAAAAAAAGLHLAVLHAAHGPEEAHLRRTAPRSTWLQLGHPTSEAARYHDRRSHATSSRCAHLPDEVHRIDALPEGARPPRVGEVPLHPRHHQQGDAASR